MSHGCPYSVESIIKVMNKKGFKPFSNPKGYDLNIVGIRTDDQTSNKFNDWVTVFFDYDGQWNFFAFPATTDPGLYWRENLANTKGTGILKEGKHKALWQIGKHQGKYKALVQANPVTVYRDNDRDNKLEKGKEDTGIFGINLHRSNENFGSINVDKWSAGCQVLQDPTQFDFLMAMCEKQVAIHGYKTFTYVLLEEKDFR